MLTLNIVGSDGGMVAVAVVYDVDSNLSKWISRKCITRLYGYHVSGPR